MELSVIISLVALVVSASSLIISVLALKQQNRQNNNYVRELKINASKEIITSHRNMFFEILKNPEFVAIVDNKPNNKFKKEMLGTILINHSYLIYRAAKEKLYSEDDWAGLQNDINDFYGWDVVNDRWKENKKYYSTDFQKFIDDLREKGRQTNIQNLDDKNKPNL